MDKYVQFCSVDQGGTVVTRLAPEAALPWHGVPEAAPPPHGVPAQPGTSALGLRELCTALLAFLCKLTPTQAVERAVLCSPWLLAKCCGLQFPGASVWHGSFSKPR